MVNWKYLSIQFITPLSNSFLLITIIFFNDFIRIYASSKSTVSKTFQSIIFQLHHCICCLCAFRNYFRKRQLFILVLKKNHHSASEKFAADEINLFSINPKMHSNKGMAGNIKTAESSNESRLEILVNVNAGKYNLVQTKYNNNELLCTIIFSNQFLLLVSKL